MLGAPVRRGKAQLAPRAGLSALHPDPFSSRDPVTYYRVEGTEGTLRGGGHVWGS